MKRKPAITRILLLFAYIFSSCSTNISEEKDIEFLNQLPISEVNTKIIFIPPRENFIEGEYIFLSLQNETNADVIFPGDYGVQIFSYNSNTKNWDRIKNSMVYLPPGDVVLSGSTPKRPATLEVAINPNLTRQAPITLRVLVAGRLTYAENRSITVAAYIDIVLQPKR